MKDIQSLGKDFRKEFIDKQTLLPKSFDPSSVYFHADAVQPSMLGAYSFALGTYPTDVSYLDYNSVLPSGSNLQSRQTEVRSALGLSTSPNTARTSKVPLNTEHGYLYWKDPLHQCPIIIEDIASEFRQVTTTTTRSSSRSGGSGDSSVVEKLISRNQESEDRTMDSVKHSHFFTDQNSYKRMLSTVGVNKGSSIKTGENTRFEVFELNGKNYVRGTRDGQAIDFAGGKNGVIELNQFLSSYFMRMSIGGVQDVCVGQDDFTGKVLPNCAKGSFVGTQRVVKTVEPVTTYQTVQRVVEQPAYQTVQRVIEQPTVQTCGLEVSKAEATREHKVDLINVGYVEIVQIPRPKIVREEVIIERPVTVERVVPVEVQVPVVEERVVIHEVEKVVTEAPTHIHHVALETPDNAVGLPPIQFHEEIDEGWPWWLFLLPLLCCIP